MGPAKVRILPLRRPQKPEVETPSSISSEDQGFKTKHQRASKPKVRTGCSTCKIRRVKCDETKPACNRCTDTGRKCDGYLPTPPRASHSRRNDAAIVSQSPEPTRGLALSPIKASPGEMRGLEYFCVKTAPDMGMYFDADFWSRFVVQASVAEPALAHAMVSVGVFNGQRELLGPRLANIPQTRAIDVADPTAMSVAFSNYNKSISLLAKRIGSASTHESTSIVLLACILFICVEFLRHDEEAALRHIKSGMTILMEAMTRAESSSGSKAMIERIRTNFLPSFNRLELLYALFGNDACWTYPFTLLQSIPETFNSVAHARDSIVHLMNLSLRFIRSVHFHKYDPSPTPSLAFDEQRALLCQIALWRARFSAYQHRHASNLTPGDHYASNVLEIQRIVSYAWVSTSLTPHECAHDAQIPLYEAAVSLAEQLSTIAGTHNQHARYSNTFTLDVELIGPLHWVAIKCREPAVRRRAIAVLHGMHRREGMWDSKTCAVNAQRVVAVEEVELREGELPSEEARVHYASMPSSLGVGPSKLPIRFRMKPFAVYGEWVEWEEVVP